MSEETDKLFDKLLKGSPEFVGLFAETVKVDLDEKSGAYLKEIYKEIRLFQRRLFNTWKLPIRRLDTILVCSLEVNSEINDDYRIGKIVNSQKLNVVIRLHARAIHIAKEISHLLKGGYADGAMARWRSLHETAVIASFLSAGKEQLSVRFSEYEAVERLRAAKTYVEHQEFLDFERISAEHVIQYEMDVEKLCQKYGNNFKKDYGWAYDQFPTSNRVTFRNIEEAVELHYLRIHYGFASKNVHSGIDSIGYKLGLSMSEEDILLAGPSNEGLIEPLQCTSLSICHATDALIALSPDTYRNTASDILWKMHDSMKKEAVEAADALLAKGRRMSARRMSRAQNRDIS